MSAATAPTEKLIPGPNWLQAVALPLGASPCGEDPRYLDDFLAIKQEIDKLQGTDYSLVVRHCRRMLAETSKDLRVAGYLLLGSVYAGGLAGLLEAVGAYRLIAENFWESCHPQKEGARISALRWLNNSKLESYLKQQTAENNREQLDELRGHIDAINQMAQNAFSEEAPRWTILDKWLEGERRKHQQPPVAEPPQSPAPAPEPGPVDTPSPAPKAVQRPLVAAPTASQPGAIDSERELVSATRAIRDYLLRNKDYLRAVGYTRALRWGALALPPEQNGLTRVAGPRPAALNELRSLLDSGEPQALFTLCEKLFLEPGGQLALDLQRQACSAAQAMGRKDLAAFIAEQTACLVRRLPELVGLHFEDGQPFADVTTRKWIEGLLAGPDPGPGPETLEDPWQGELNELLAEARGLLQKKKLPAALGILKGCATRNEKQRLQLRLTIARLCLEGGRPEVAEPVLDELCLTVQAKSLDVWDPPLAIEAWKLLLETCQALQSKSSGKDKEALGARVAELRALICCTDMEAAARLF